ncbi:response regulator transcription factor, partial [Pelagibacterales bacterium SAG-MED23]|nr:response regulator transcription factor [Pelagibacterales bacterium SAG-MED23]
LKNKATLSFDDFSFRCCIGKRGLSSKKKNFLFISKKKIKNIENQIEISQFPIGIAKLIESINIKFLKNRYTHQSEIIIGSYSLNLNSRKISNNFKNLNLTEREANILLFLNNSIKPVKISRLQTEVWGHNSKLETHTVETHIYRLRKKIKDIFGDDNLIKSSKLGYSF